MAGNFAKVVGLDDGQPLLLAVTSKKHRRDLAIGRIALGLLHPLFRLDLLAPLDFAVEWKISADDITASAFWIASVLLGAPSFLPTLFAQVRRKLPLSRRTFAP